jgi:cell wall-associated NlpC family hydrolase
MPFALSLRRVSLLVALALSLTMVTAAPVAAGKTETDTVIDIARQQLGKPWVWGATGPNKFDCSGFVFYSFREAGLVDRIGNKRRTVQGYWNWFAKRGLASKTGGQRGDLIVWGDAKHIGIFLGDGWAISVLTTTGVTIHRIDKINLPFRTFLRVQMQR